MRKIIRKIKSKMRLGDILLNIFFTKDVNEIIEVLECAASGEMRKRIKEDLRSNGNLINKLKSTVNNTLDCVELRNIERRKAEVRLLLNEQKFRSLVETTNDWIWEMDKDARFTYSNSKVEDLLGYSPEEILNKSVYALMSEEEAMRLSEMYSGSSKEAKTFSGHVNLTRHKDGHYVVLESSGVPIFSPDGEFVGHRGIDRDITKRKKAEDELKEAYQCLQDKNQDLMVIHSELQSANKHLSTNELELKKSLKEKVLLIQEIHHRVKNNMQLISSIVNLQANYVGKSDITDIFVELQTRIHSMAVIHDSMYTSENCSDIDFPEFIKSLLSYLEGVYVKNVGDIAVKLDLEQIHFGVDIAVPLGIVFNELLSNAFKHAFSDGIKGHVTVNLFNDKVNDLFCLEVKDNGVGLPETFDIKEPHTLGLVILEALSRQLKAELSVVNDNGACFSFKFKA